jgi:hypothetical protein
VEDGFMSGWHPPRRPSGDPHPSHPRAPLPLVASCKASDICSAEPGVGRQSGAVAYRERLGGLLTYDYREAAWCSAGFQPYETRRRSPAAETVFRHLSKISVTVGPFCPSNRPLTTRLMPLLAACGTLFGDGAWPRPNLERDMPVCHLAAFCVFESARQDRQLGSYERTWEGCVDFRTT